MSAPKLRLQVRIVRKDSDMRQLEPEISALLAQHHDKRCIFCGAVRELGARLAYHWLGQSGWETAAICAVCAGHDEDEKLGNRLARRLFGDTPRMSEDGENMMAQDYHERAQQVLQELLKDGYPEESQLAILHAALCEAVCNNVDTEEQLREAIEITKDAIDEGCKAAFDWRSRRE